MTALSKRKQELVDEMRRRGFSDEEVARHCGKSTLANIQTAIDNDETHRVITRMASGKDRAMCNPAVTLLKEAQEVLGRGGLCSIGSGGWGSCDHCGGWPDHKPSCLILRLEKFLKGEGL